MQPPSRPFISDQEPRPDEEGERERERGRDTHHPIPRPREKIEKPSVDRIERYLCITTARHWVLSLSGRCGGSQIARHRGYKKGNKEGANNGCCCFCCLLHSITHFGYSRAP